MTANPIDVVGGLTTTANVPKADITAWVKARVRQRMADATEVRNTSLSGQFAGIYVRSLQNSFDLDTSDTTTADDGINCIIDFDGNRFKKVAVSVSETQRLVTAAGDVTLAGDAEDFIIIKKTVGAATAVHLPSAADRTKSIVIIDGKGDANTNNITMIPVSGQTIFAIVNYNAIIDSNGGLQKLTPLADGSGWF